MTKAIIYSFKKSIRLKKISNVLGIAAKLDPSELIKYMASENFEKDREREEKAMEELLTLCESDIYTIRLMKKYNANRETLRRAYEKLIMIGCGQWKRGYYVPASSLVYNQTLDYLLKNIDKEGDDFRLVAWRLLEYFEKGKFGKIKEEKILSGEEYLMENLRLMVELTPLQKKWIELEEEVFGITSVTDDVDWEKLNKKGKLLLEESYNLFVHYGEDRQKIYNETDEENLKNLELFLRQSFIYVDMLHRTIMKLVIITNHLYKMTIDPGSWSAKEYFKELDQYKSLCDEYHKEGDKMNEELEKMQNVTLKIK